ncbi:ABC transporter ATP-binding protein [Leifsonia aquatica]|uniref:ABC transporter ATP-binding protein n=1 Tax=Leifsonia aquatica TaxID=144185 RepID=UPI00046ACCBA|nr:ABC transporter ATP-binding protein [Leifsonia aquatica]
MSATTLLPVAAPREVRRFAARALAGSRMTVMATAAALVVGGGAGLGIPGGIGWVAQLLTDGAEPVALVGPLALLAACALLGGLAAWASGVLLARAVLPPLGRLREDVVDAAVALPLAAVEAGSGDLVSRVTDDVEQVAEVAQGALARLLTATVTIAVTLVGLAGLDLRFALAALVAVPVQVVTVLWYLGRSERLYAEGRRATGRRASTLLETFAALPTVRAFGLAGDRCERAREASAAVVDVELEAARTMTRFYGRLNLAEFLGLGAILVVAFVLVRSTGADIGQATAAALFFAGLFDPINAALGTADDLQRASASLARLVGVVEAGSRVPRGRSAPADRGGVVLEGVRFGYDGVPLLTDVELVIPSGSHVAVVGTTGSGKSTLAAVIAGVRAVDRGQVRVGGIPIDTVDPARRAEAVALVSQETHVFAGTVVDNLLLGAAPQGGLPESAAAAAESVDAALAAVGARGWIDGLPEGVATRVGAGGHPLTPQQAQHLALARLLLVDPAVVVLDEATAESGSDVARILDDAARAAIAGRTAIVVAHRLEQAVEADLVIVLEGGAIVESGAPADLIAAGGAFATLWKRGGCATRDVRSPIARTMAGDIR